MPLHRVICTALRHAGQRLRDTRHALAKSSVNRLEGVLLPHPKAIAPSERLQMVYP